MDKLCHVLIKCWRPTAGLGASLQILLLQSSPTLLDIPARLERLCLSNKGICQAVLYYIVYVCVCVCADTHAYACVHVCMHVYAKECVCRPEDNIVEMTLPSTMWDLWIKLRMLVLVANVFICQVILLSCVPILIPQGDDIWRL